MLRIYYFPLKRKKVFGQNNIERIMTTTNDG